MVWITGFFIFLFGLALGSFLNVCIYRLPRNQSIVLPPSFCPHCRRTLAPYDNIPLLSFIILRGRCRACQQAIPFRYAAVELASGLLWLGCWRLYGLTPDFAAALVFLSLLLTAAVTDLETGLVPDSITLPGMLLGLAASAAYPPLLGESIWYRGLLQSVGGLVTGGVMLWLTALLAERILRKEAMGGGDVKLLALAGAWLGAPKTAVVFFLAAFFALPSALYQRLAKKGHTVRYGPFLALAAATLFFFGGLILRYLRLD